MRDGTEGKPCISFSAREVQPKTKPAEARVEEEKGPRPFSPAPTAAMEGWRTRPWSFTLRAEPASFFLGPVAEKKSNLYYTFGMGNDEKPIEKALRASSSAAITSEDSVNSNLVTSMVDSGASGHYFDDAIIRDLKHRLQDYVHLATPCKILNAGEAMLHVADDYGSQIFDRVDIVVMLGIGRNLFSVMTAVKKNIVTIFDYEKHPGWRGSVPLQSEIGDLYLFVLDLSVDGYGAKELATKQSPMPRCGPSGWVISMHSLSSWATGT